MDKWKNAADKNAALGFADSVLSGYGQIVFNDNPLSGLLFLAGGLVGSVQAGASSLVCTIAAALAAYLIGVPEIALRKGLYTFSAALAGFGIAVFVFPGQGVTARLLFYSALCGVVSVLMTGAFESFLSKWDLPYMAFPYCASLAILVPAAAHFTNLGAAAAILPHLEVAAPLGSGHIRSAADFFAAVMNNFAEVIWQSNAVSGALLLLGILVASRVDFFMAVTGSVSATAFAIALGLPDAGVMAGNYGFNAVLLMIVMFGRAYAMSVKNFVFSSALALITVILTVCLNVILAPAAIPVGALPYVITAVLAMASDGAFTGLTRISPGEWGTPETIAAARRRRAAETGGETR
jgi:urea transporter